LSPGPWEHGSASKIGRITTAGVVTEFATPTSPAVPLGIAAGPDGNLWFTENGARRIAQIAASGAITELNVLTFGPHGITAGSDGNLWFIERSSNRIGRLTP
jgi:virginiamycin B lyase